jgi:F-type H+-transporting ATPase subunit gamma
VVAHTTDLAHPLAEVRPERESKRAVLLVTSDKGLCGALNANLLRETGRFDKDGTLFIAAGKKGSQFLARTKRRLAAEFSYKDAPLFSEARAISRFVQDLFLKGVVHQVDILFTNFISTLNQRPEVRPFLPVGEIRALEADVAGGEAAAKLERSATEYLFEPGADVVFGALLPHYLNFQVYQVLLEAKASEHSARMVAMKNATDNAKQLIKDLTLEYNKMRQTSITNELLEISTAQMALG